MKLIFVHGWSVTHTNTYGDLPKSIASASRSAGLDIDIRHIQLGKYISFHDEVTRDDIARALDKALRDLPGNSADQIEPFSCITHSTGGPVVRTWVDKYYGSRTKLASVPLQHLVMLAPANHGSSLAVIGKKRVGRIKAWFNGIEPGQRVLDWLSLGSEGQWQLNENALSYGKAGTGFFPFVIAGQGIDTKAYDFLNSYLAEPGSDGVVRVAGANMNYRHIALQQSDEAIPRSKYKALKLIPKQASVVKRVQAVPLAVLSKYSHSGTDMGIMRISAKKEGHKKIVSTVLKCLQVTDSQHYADVQQEFLSLTQSEQQKVPKGKKSKIGRYSMLLVRVRDDQGNTLHQEDYDIHLLGGPTYDADKLPPGFFVDKQMNKSSDTLVYYLNADKMNEVGAGKFGIRVLARPEKGFSYFKAGEFRSEGFSVDKVFSPNETTYLDIELHRFVDQNVFRFQAGNKKAASFKRIKPSGKSLS